jgi:Family of unknown function (DUF5946)
MDGHSFDAGSHASGWTVCPGCGVNLPGQPEFTDGRRNASPPCWLLYGEVAGYELAHLARLGRLHQLMADTYGAQHAGPWVPRIGTAFSLIGLRLALDEDATGLEVRAAHQYLAQNYREWPAFARPTRSAHMTVFDVAMAESPDRHEVLLKDWAQEVWAEWAGVRVDVARIITDRLPREVRQASRWQRDETP